MNHTNICRYLFAVLAGLVSSSLVAQEKWDDEATFFGHYQAWANTELGCNHDGKLYGLGETVVINQADLETFRKVTGQAALDGYAILMMCSFPVSFESGDYPIPSKRNWGWVAVGSHLL